MADNDLQADADKGMLAAARATSASAQWQKTLEVLTDRRWIVGKVTEIAVAHDISPDQFTALCEAIAKFIRPAGPEIPR